MTGLSRFFPNTRETAEEVKRRVYRTEGVAVIRVDDDDIPWDLREQIRQWADKRFGKRTQG